MLPVSILRSGLMLILVLSLSLVSNAQAKPEHGKKFKDWTIACEKLPSSGKEMCSVVQVLSSENKNVTIQIAITYPPGKTEPHALFKLPLGVSLRHGIEFSAGKAKVALPYTVCMQQGCIVNGKLDKDMISAMKKASEGVIKFAAMPNKVVGAKVSLSGFTAALKSLK